ncbi:MULTISPECIES: hypothetical protein [Caballeronia]|uniref:hypothetical protein n=1 Tax=Caballeronia TaxID=1827195 RepID=UPI001FD3BD45|nr:MULTISPECIES: hypothetical protein [Caballeronia]MDR5799012.1 hypothetical protein [Caballeronia sp. LZ001]
MAAFESPSLVRLHGVERSDRVSTYAEVAALVNRCREALTAANVHIKPNSALGALFSKADKLNRFWIAQTDQEDIRTLIEADEAARIAESVLSAVNDPAASQAIRRITKSDMHLSTRQPSQGKDALWELSLRRFLQLRNVPTRFKDPPDLEIMFSKFGDYGIACKKVYSQESVGKQLAKGLKQIEPYRGSGMVAFNLDDLTPGESILAAATKSEASARLASINVAFIEKHRLRFQTAIKQGKCDGIWVSSTVHADIAGVSPRFNRITENTLWTINEARLGTHMRIAEIRQLIDGGGRADALTG